MLPNCRAVFFDVVGTLLHPEPSAGIVYAAVGERFGSRRPVEEIAARFRAAFARQDELDRLANYRTDEARELARWRAIVAEVLDDVADRVSCFDFLYRHFAQPSAWRVEPAAADVLPELAKRGLATGLASNFDRRLREVIAGHDDFNSLPHLIISSEVGWRKPSLHFFAAVCDAVQLPAEQVLFIGDDPLNDYEGARAAGLAALLYDPHRQTALVPRIGQLDELLQ